MYQWETVIQYLLIGCVSMSSIQSQLEAVLYHFLLNPIGYFCTNHMKLNAYYRIYTHFKVIKSN